MDLQSTRTETNSSSTDRGGPNGRRMLPSTENMIQNINQEELDDGILKEEPKPKLPTELAFENDVVLLGIFRHSSPSDLKEFRLVNRQWNDTATSTLLITNSLELQLKKLEEKLFIGRGIAKSTSDPLTSAPPLSSQQQFSNIPFRYMSLTSLTDLCRLIESSVKFPTKSITFQRNYADAHPQMRQLLKIFGSQVKELTFDSSCQVSISFLRELLLDLVPNLETLKFLGCTLVAKKQPPFSTDQDGNNSFDCDRIHSLPYLTQLVFLPDDIDLVLPNSDYLLYVDLFSELVDAARNLRSVYARPLDFLEILLDAGKLQLVKKLTLVPTMKVEKRLGGAVEVRPVAIYQKLASMKPEIKTLTIRCLKYKHGWGSYQFELLDKLMFKSAASSVLESCKDSVHDLGVEMLPGYSVDFPVLPNLKKFSVEFNSDGQQEFNAGLSTHNPTFSFQRNFPHLHEFHLWLCSFMDAHIKDHVFSGELKKWMSPTVKHLTLGGNTSYQGEGEIDSPYEGPQTIGKMFPNATSVVIVYAKCSPYDKPLSSIIWHQIPADVKSLSITNLAVKEPFQDTMDTFFTGMPIKICKIFRKLPQRICEEKDILDALRTEPSICVFKNLEELNICCNDLQSEHPFASHVTGLYAFDLMPQLKVTVTYKPQISREVPRENLTPSEDMNRSLKHIAPYITQVCHEKLYKY